MPEHPKPPGTGNKITDEAINHLYKIILLQQKEIDSLKKEHTEEDD